MNYTLITGASRGIGRALAHECANRLMNLVLVARSLEDLVELKNEISARVDVDVHCVQLDLNDSKSGEFLQEYIETNGLEVNVLINNAGIGLYGEFYNSDLNSNIEMIKINITSIVNVTHALIPLLQNNDESHVLNVASTAAFRPIPKLTVYSATKSFVYFFSRGLRKELKEYGVKVSCLMPGPTKTNFFNQAGMVIDKGMTQKMLLTPEEVAYKAVRGMFKNKTKIIPGAYNKLQYFLFSVIPPSWSTAILNRTMENRGR